MSAHKRYFLTTVAPMAVVVGVATVWSGVLLTEVPDPMPVQFGSDESSTRHLSPLGTLVLTSGISALVVLGFAFLAHGGLWSGAAARFSAASAGFIVTLLSTLEVIIFTFQSGSLSLPVLLSAVAALALFSVAKPVPKSPSDSNGETIIDAPEPGQDKWVHTEQLNRPLQVILIITLVALVAAAILLDHWLLYLLPIVTVFAILTSWSWTLKIDSRGFTYRSPLRIPHATIPYSEIENAKVIEINPGDWVGWGWRIKPSGTGLIAQGGKGIRIEKRDGKALEASCHDAETAVALLKRQAKSGDTTATNT